MVTRSRLIVLAAALGLSALAPAAAHATAPTLDSLGHDATNHLTAAWTLPAGEQNWELVAGKSATPDPDFGLAAGAGSYSWHAGDPPFGFMTTTQTSFTSPAPLNPGTYYARIGTCPAGSGGCAAPELEWSNILSMVIPEAGGGGGGTGGGGGGGGGTGPEQPTCPAKKRFSGQTSQGQGICFNVSTQGNKTFVKNLSFAWTAGCDVGTAEGLYDNIKQMKVSEKGKFHSSSFHSDLTLAGKLKKNGAKGTLRVEPGGGACDTGVVNWSANKG